jgi:hypothetical protein
MRACVCVCDIHIACFYSLSAVRVITLALSTF